MPGTTYTIGTRKSALAMWQTEYVRHLLEPIHIQDEFKIKGMVTSGDNQNISISKEGGKGLYIQRLEEALVSKEIDLCVHSLKDLPVKQMDGCEIAAIVARGEIADVFISRDKIPLERFDASMKIGTSSLRRRAQLKARNIPSEICEIRGNVDTRINKMKAGEVDGILLAGAGIFRLGFEKEITEILDPFEFIPAPGQGAIAIECRSDDIELKTKLKQIHHEPTYQAITAERAFLEKLGGSCMLPLGALCQIEQFQMVVNGFLADPDGTKVMTERLVGPLGDPFEMGQKLGERFLHQGAQSILDKL
jgi:hydroxymethylbilane synthase